MRKIREGNVSKKQIVENKGIDLSNRFKNIEKQKQYEIDRIKKEKDYREERQWKREEDKLDRRQIREEYKEKYKMERKLSRNEDFKDYLSKTLRLLLALIIFIALIYLLQTYLPDVYSWIVDELFSKESESFYSNVSKILYH